MYNVFYASHRRERNPLHNDDIIYTPQVVVFKTDTANPVLMQERDWYSVNVVTCAAPNLREDPSNGYNCGDGNLATQIDEAQLLALHEKRLRKILAVAATKGNDVVILGAFGCGVFRNPPQIVAQAAKNIITEFAKCFKVIEFAVYCSNDDSNFMEFERILTK